MSRIIIPLFVLLILFAACSTLKLEPADFAWPLESVLKVDDNGSVKDERYSFSFDTRGLFFAENNDSLSYKGKNVRILRDKKGYYFMTSNKFKNVYVFEVVDGALQLKNKIFISEFGIADPAFNQRPPNVELIDGGKSLYLDNNGIVREQE